MGKLRVNYMPTEASTALLTDVGKVLKVLFHMQPDSVGMVTNILPTGFRCRRDGWGWRSTRGRGAGRGDLGPFPVTRIPSTGLFYIAHRQNRNKTSNINTTERACYHGNSGKYPYTLHFL